MTPTEWTSPLAGVALTVVVIALGYLGLRGGALRRSEKRRFGCPELGADVDCEMVQDVRTGQWKAVQSCSAFAADEGLPCAQECRKVLNAGYALPRAHA
jgi:hypothetical protein